MAEALDIHEVMLYRWRMEMRRGRSCLRRKKCKLIQRSNLS
ncbi:hypothetical protein [Microbulbifer bruguierae]